MKAIRTILALSFCLLVSACVESEAPLTPPAPLSPDSPLIGSWVIFDTNETMFFHVGNEGAAAKILEVELSKDGSIKSKSYIASAVAQGGNEYLSVQVRSGEKLLYSIWKYQLTGNNTLTLWPANYQFLENAVNKGLIVGTVEPKGPVPRVQLSADSNALLLFVGKYSSQMFPKATIKLQRAR
jgi:hypothetical protein